MNTTFEDITKVTEDDVEFFRRKVLRENNPKTKHRLEKQLNVLEETVVNYREHRNTEHGS